MYDIVYHFVIELWTLWTLGAGGSTLWTLQTRGVSKHTSYFLIQFQYGKECFLRHFDVTDLFHSLLSFFLFFQ